MLRTLDKAVSVLLPLAVRIWYDKEKGYFYLASLLPEGSTDLATRAQFDVRSAHKRLQNLRVFLQDEKFTGSNFGIDSTTIFFYCKRNRFTLVDWSDYTTGPNSKWKLQHEKNRETHGCVKAKDGVQRDFKYLVALADVYESSFFSQDYTFFPRNLPSRWLRHTNPESEEAATTKWVTRSRGVILGTLKEDGIFGERNFK